MAGLAGSPAGEKKRRRSSSREGKERGGMTKYKRVRQLRLKIAVFKVI